ncbi:MAG TPA: thioredoxin family protein [Fimbriimonadaceae bacterium]|nr:thioredoxin family protein [Fimbriimonadaceae bacterium]
MRNLLGVFVVLAASASLALAQVPAQPASTPSSKVEREKFDPKRDAAKDIANAISKATKENKRIILDVGGEWCGWCHKLDEFFATNAEAKKLLKDHYIVVKVNFSPENKNETVLSKYPEIKGYPHLFVLEKDGKLLHSQDTGLLETGPAHDAAKVIPFLKKWVMPKA